MRSHSSGSSTLPFSLFPKVTSRANQESSGDQSSDKHHVRRAFATTPLFKDKARIGLVHVLKASILLVWNAQNSANIRRGRHGNFVPPSEPRLSGLQYDGLNYTQYTVGCGIGKNAFEPKGPVALARVAEKASNQTPADRNQKHCGKDHQHFKGPPSQVHSETLLRGRCKAATNDRHEVKGSRYGGESKIVHEWIPKTSWKGKKSHSAVHNQRPNPTARFVAHVFVHNMPGDILTLSRAVITP